jgi:hypothetical protein
MARPRGSGLNVADAGRASLALPLLSNKPTEGFPAGICFSEEKA